MLHATVLATGLIGQLCSAQSFDKTPLVSESAKQFLHLNAPANKLDSSSNTFWVTGLYANNLIATVSSNVLFVKSNSACSAYDNTICHPMSEFYAPTNPQFIATGIWRLSKDTIVHLGLNTGFQSPKLTVSPALFLGLAQRFFLDSKQLSHFVIEGTTWVGSRVEHKPCTDNYNREYFCGNLTAWSDYKYETNPHSYAVKIWYERRF